MAIVDENGRSYTKTGEELGSGGQGIVLKVRANDNGESYTLKVYRHNKNNIRENIITILDAWDGNQYPSCKAICRFVQNLAYVFAALHMTHGMCYKDVNEGNILTGDIWWVAFLSMGRTRRSFAGSTTYCRKMQQASFSGMTPCLCGIRRTRETHFVEANLVTCPSCGTQTFRESNTCFSCGAKILPEVRASLQIVSAAHKARVITVKSRMGIRNISRTSWRAAYPDGTIRDVEPGKIVTLSKGIRINIIRRTVQMNVIDVTR